MSAWWCWRSRFRIACALLVGLLAGAALAGCETALPPTPTLTPEPPPLEPSPTFDIRPPSAIPLDPFEADQPGVTILEAARLPADSDFVPGEDDLPPVPDDYRPQLLSLPLADGGQLVAELFVGQAGRTGVLLIGAPFDDWGGFPAQLHERGHSVLVVEARIPPLEGDVSVMLTALITLGNPQGDVVVVGAAQGADVALLGCASDPRCGTAILLSPRQQGALVAAMTDYNPRPLLLVASLDDLPALQAVEALRIAARGDVLLQPFESAGIGTQMLDSRPDLRGLITNWIDRFSARQPG